MKILRPDRFCMRGSRSRPSRSSIHSSGGFQHAQASCGVRNAGADTRTYHARNYRTMWARAPFGRALVNSTLVATTITLAVLVFGSMTAYAMARLRFRGRPVLNAATMAILLVPGQLTLIPLYTLIVQLGWIDTYAALIVPYLFNATAILMLRQFFLQIPQSLIDSARMDGMSELRILFTIFWPLSKPVLSIVAIFTFMGASSPATPTVTVGSIDGRCGRRSRRPGTSASTISTPCISPAPVAQRWW